MKLFSLTVSYDNVRQNAVLQKDSGAIYFDLIRNHFSYVDENSLYGKKKGKIVRKYLITAKGRFGVGLVWEINKFLVSENIPIKLRIEKEVVKKLVNPIDIPIKETALKLRDYQTQSIKSFFKSGNGIELVGTGGGKTLIMATILESFYHKNKKMKAIVVVPDVGLLKQTFGDFEKYKCSFSFSKYGNGHDRDDTSNVIICNAAILVKRDNDNDWIDERKILMYDEVHRFNATSKISTIFLCRNFDYRLGFTGSLPTNGYDKNYILSHFGRVVYTKTSKELRDMEFLTNVSVQFIKFNHKDAHEIYDLSVGVDFIENYRRETDFINNSMFRNNFVQQICRATGKNILILVERIEQGEILYDTLSELTNRNVTFVQGKVKPQDRADIIQTMEESNNNICIAMSKIFSTGISIDNLHYLIFSNLGKKDVKTVQSIGRGLRLHETKGRLIIFDLYDNLLYSEKHAEERKIIYDMEKINYKIKEVTQ